MTRFWSMGEASWILTAPSNGRNWTRRDKWSLHERAILAGIAAAESVLDEERRRDLFLLLRPAAPQLPSPVRRELTRAVERLISGCAQCQSFAGDAGFADQTAFGFFAICIENHLYRFK
jgi:hypothetical protein